MRALCALVLFLTSAACSGQDKTTTTPAATEQPEAVDTDTTPAATEPDGDESGAIDSDEPCPEMPSCDGE